MVFGRKMGRPKKNLEAPAPPPQPTEVTEPTIIKPMTEEERKEEADMLERVMGRFKTHYDGVFTPEDLEKMNEGEKEALHANILFSIYSELRGVRKDMEK